MLKYVSNDEVCNTTVLDPNISFYVRADLENNDTLNALAKEYSGMQNDSERFGMEHFEYNNSVIVEQMMTNWETTTFLGVTVRSRLS